MSRRAGALLAAVGLAAALLGGCGIPDQTDVRVDGPGPRPGAGGVGLSPQEPPTRSATNTTCVTSSDVQCSTQLIHSFLAAPAGELGRRAERVREFVSPEAQDELDFSSGVSVVDLVGAPSFDDTQVRIRVRHIGVLEDSGELAPPRSLDEETYTMEVGNIEGSQGLFVLRPPSELLMSRTALNDYYTARTIYFWNQAATMLVPDLRYLPNAVPYGRVPTELLTYLTTGPAAALKGTAVGLPTESKLSGTAPIDDGMLTTSWNPQTFDGDIDKLATQIVWSLGSTYPFDRLAIQVNGAPKKDFDQNQIEARRGAVAYPVSRTPERYAIFEGGVRRLAGSTGAQPGLPLAPEVNRNLLSAAFVRTDKVLAAAIVATGDGDGALRVGSGAGTVTALRPTSPVLSTTARPAWLPSARVGLVPVDGRLWRFGVDGAAAELKLPGVSGRVTSVAVSPEGQRIAVIADGKLYFVPLVILGAGPTVSASQARLITTTGSGLTAVAWTSETRVVVAGPTANGRSQLVDVTVDGFAESPRSGDATGTIEQISYYPDVPVLRTRVEPVLFEAGNSAWRIERVTPTQIPRSELVGETAASPAPGTEGAKPTSPFYIY